jgi:glucosamine kinase
MSHPLLIGIDGGGTSCRGAALCEGRLVSCSLPGANASSDFEGAVAAVLAVSRALAEALSLPVERLWAAPAYLGLAGVVDPHIAARLRRGLPFERAVIEEDRRASVVDALGASEGAAAVIGTGSFLARQSGGAMRFQGGYGLALGDEASGAWLGREALAASLRAGEGWGPVTDLTRGLWDEMGGRSGIIGFAQRARPRDLAELAPGVVAAAEGGDAQARALLARGAGHIAEGLAALGWQEGEALCLTGGLGAVYGPALPPVMRAALVRPQGQAPEGALTLAGWVAEGRLT